MKEYCSFKKIDTTEYRFNNHGVNPKPDTGAPEWAILEQIEFHAGWVARHRAMRRVRDHQGG